MKNNLINQKGNMQLIIIVIIIVAIALGVYLVQQRTSLLPKAYSPKNTSQTIDSSSDLERNLNELENTNINQLDQGISENNSDVNSF